MKKLFIILGSLLLGSVILYAQPPKQKAPTQSETDKMMEEAMKGMSESEKAEMRKMMKDMMPALTETSSKMADYPEFTSNKELVPKKDIARINAIPKKKLVQADIGGYASNLYNKLLTKGNATEMAIVKKVIAASPKASDIGGASILCMLQGYPQAAMALSMKAVQADPSNPNWQNNMASLLTQYGYPEQAIPVLQKLKNQFPQNSTVLNNLGQAWLGLGELDSGKIYIKKAGGLNPNHPEAKETEGVIEEISGNTDKATDDYIKAMENSVNPFTEMLIKNNKGQGKLNKIDFEKLKRSITIYEYFPKDWITIPKLSDNVSGYENDMKIKNGYDKMFEELETKINQLKDAAEHQINTSLDKGDAAFAKEFANESLKGVSMMSKPAIIVQNILQMYLAEWMQKNVNETAAFIEMINSKRKEMTKSGKNDKCPDMDRKNNDFLSYANPRIREFYATKIEEFRNWLNAYCTWTWYIAGNPKNIVIVQCVSWTAALQEMYQNAIEEQRTEWRSCVQHHGDDVAQITAPEIPNFTCPMVVSIPMGRDWQQLSNAVKNFDNNTSSTKQNPNNPVPHGSTAYGADHGSIAQPGRDAFTKSANGSISPGMFNDDLTPLSKIPLDELTPLPNLPNENDPVPLPDLRKSKLAKELLNKMMTGDCKNVKSSKDILREQLERMMKGVKELEAYEHVIEEIKRLEAEIEQKEADAQKKDQLKKQIERMQQETDKMDKYEQVQQSKKELEKIMKEMEAMDDKKFMKEKFDKIMESVNEMDAAPAILKGIQQIGLQPSLNSGIQVPGTFTPVKGLFQ